MHVSDNQVHPIDDGEYDTAIRARITRALEENPTVDPVRMANRIADELSPEERRYLIVDAIHSEIEIARVLAD
jgi:hypothetical protein